MVKTMKPTNADKIQVFLGLCILMGLMYKPRDWKYWSIDAFYSTPVFSQVIFRERFQLILKFLCFQDYEDPSYHPQDAGRDRFFMMRPMLNMLRQRFNTIYPPADITQ